MVCGLVCIVAVFVFVCCLPSVFCCLMFRFCGGFCLGCTIRSVCLLTCDCCLDLVVFCLGCVHWF